MARKVISLDLLLWKFDEFINNRSRNESMKALTRVRAGSQVLSMCYRPIGTDGHYRNLRGEN